MYNDVKKHLLGIGEGWCPFVEPVLEDISRKGGTIVQVKEKFGGLRIYTHGGDYEAISDLIRGAESAVSHICEECGKVGSLSQNKRGWMKTLCIDHIGEQNAE
jgi:hypothetical protein